MIGIGVTIGGTMAGTQGRLQRRIDGIVWTLFEIVKAGVAKPFMSGVHRSLFDDSVKFIAFVASL